MLRRLRQTDRFVNEARYPKLFYPNLYLLEGGYRAFFEQYPHLCEPQGYVAMKDERFATEAKESGMQVRRSWKRHKSFSNLQALKRTGSCSF